MAITGVEGAVLLAARVLFGVVMAFNGTNHFAQSDQMTEYARHKGVPAARASVLATGAVLVLGGLSIAAGILPLAGAAILAAFLVASAVSMHDFWAVPEEQKQDELTHFLKNLALTGGALAFAAIAGQEWAYSLDLGLL